MLGQEVPFKTALGRSEVADRRIRLGSRQRVLLIAINGEHDVRDLRRQFRALGDVDALLAELVAIGLVTSAGGDASAPASAHEAKAEDAIPPVPLVRQFMNESVVANLGLRAFLFTLKIERCYTRQELTDLLPEYRRMLAKALDAESVAAFSARAEALIERI
ncbi:MAG: hypothetical protein J0L88_14785 [Xanthomonadales bacterium]|nr:hypothetical protein [Xanthomonadales bacterium]